VNLRIVSSGAFKLEISTAALSSQTDVCGTTFPAGVNMNTWSILQLTHVPIIHENVFLFFCPFLFVLFFWPLPILRTVRAAAPNVAGKHSEIRRTAAIFIVQYCLLPLSA